MFKILAGLIIVLALVIGIVPQFTDCQSHGRAIALANGTTVPMKCHWTARRHWAWQFHSWAWAASRRSLSARRAGESSPSWAAPGRHCHLAAHPPHRRLR